MYILYVGNSHETIVITSLKLKTQITYNKLYNLVKN